MNKILVIQTSFLGDVILATSMLEKLHAHFPDAQIDICVRKGNESLLKAHPFLKHVHIWDKKSNKYKNLFALSKKIRAERYDIVVNLQRYGGTAFMTLISGAKETIGFNKNLLSVFYTRRFEHKISTTGRLHETEQNHKLIAHLTDKVSANPRLYPSKEDTAIAQDIAGNKKFVTISPASVWFTKQLPEAKWLSLINSIPEDVQVIILGGPDDKAMGERLLLDSKRENILNLVGELNLLRSAALMQYAQMNYVNDSAPLHLCSAMNAPVTAFFCSTVPEFGFTPLSDNSTILQTGEKLDCRPCGTHGFMKCPKGHFKCGQIGLPEFNKF